jgi:hypothetical protein
VVGKSRLNRSLPVQINFHFRSAPKPGSTSHFIACVFAIIVSLVCIGIGVAQLWKQRGFRHWVEVPCEIERFEISTHLDEKPTFRPDLVFHYAWDGQKLTAGELWSAKRGDEAYETLAATRENFRGKSASVCFVNPTNPVQAALLRNGSSGGSGGWVAVAFGSFFLLMMLGVMAGSNRAVIFVAGVGFSTVGFGLLGGLSLPLVRDYFAMKRWQPVPAEVVWSRVVESRGNKSTSYKPDVFYRYEAGGEKRFSNHFTLVPVSTNLTSGTRNTVKEYAAGKSIVCYVNPHNPWQAIVHRELRWSCLFALLPVPFAVAGVYLLKHVIREMRRSESGLQEAPAAAKTPRRRSRAALANQKPRGTWKR